MPVAARRRGIVRVDATPGSQQLSLKAIQQELSRRTKPKAWSAFDLSPFTTSTIEDALVKDGVSTEHSSYNPAGRIATEPSAPRRATSPRASTRRSRRGTAR